MRGLEIWFHDLIASDDSSLLLHTHFDANGGGGGAGGGLFLEHSVVSFPWDRRRDHRLSSSGRFMSVTLSSSNETNSQSDFSQHRYKNITHNNNFNNINSEDETASFEMVEEYKEEHKQLKMKKKKKKKDKVKLSGGASAFNTTKHLWAGAVSAMVSRLYIIYFLLMLLIYICFNDCYVCYTFR